MGLRAGYSLPLGDWRKNRVAPSVTLFGAGLSLGGDIDVRLSDRLSLAFTGGYASLNGSAWEEYATARGSNVKVSAWIGHAGVLLKPYLKSNGRDLVSLAIGPVLFFGGGNETVGTAVYEYDFLGSVTFGGLGALEYDRMMWDNLALTVNVSALVVPSGLDYADGLSRSVVALPISVGLRVIF